MKRFAAVLAPLLLAAMALPANAAGSDRSSTAPSHAGFAPAPIFQRAPRVQPQREPARRRPPRPPVNPWLGVDAQGGWPMGFCRVTYRPGDFRTADPVVVYSPTSRNGCIMVPWGLAGFPWILVPAPTAPSR